MLLKLNYEEDIKWNLAGIPNHDIFIPIFSRQLENLKKLANVFRFQSVFSFDLDYSLQHDIGVQNFNTFLFSSISFGDRTESNF